MLENSINSIWAFIQKHKCICEETLCKPSRRNCGLSTAARWAGAEEPSPGGTARPGNGECAKREVWLPALGASFDFGSVHLMPKPRAVFQHFHPTPPRSNQPLGAGGTARRMLIHTEISCGPSEKQARVSVRALCPAFHLAANCVTFSHGFPSPI